MSSRGSTWKVWKAQVIIRAPKADGCSYHAGTLYVAIMEFDEETGILSRPRISNYATATTAPMTWEI